MRIFSNVLRTIVLIVAALVIAAVLGYGSAMFVYIFGLEEYGEYIMWGVFIVSALYLIAANHDLAWKNEKDKPHYDSRSDNRDYFKDGNFSARKV
ncbi:MAG: hypothetical protein IJ770_00170 [Alphaproteobacteria bacterium]|nr:hypothetical protein [Alphaproteobacteria bacterium]